MPGIKFQTSLGFLVEVYRPFFLNLNMSFSDHFDVFGDFGSKIDVCPMMTRLIFHN